MTRHPFARPIAVVAVAALTTLSACSDDGATLSSDDSASTASNATDSAAPAVTDANNDTDPSTPESSAPTAESDDESPPVGFPTTVYDVGTIDPALQPFIDIAVSDLAARLDIDTASIDNLTGVLVVWSDASIGCPLPDMIYAPGVFDGALIELGVDDLVYRYHSGGSREPFLCNLDFDDTLLTESAGGGSDGVDSDSADTGSTGTGENGTLVLDTGGTKGADEFIPRDDPDI